MRYSSIFFFFLKSLLGFWAQVREGTAIWLLCVVKPQRPLLCRLSFLLSSYKTNSNHQSQFASSKPEFDQLSVDNSEPNPSLRQLERMKQLWDLELEEQSLSPLSRFLIVWLRAATQLFCSHCLIVRWESTTLHLTGLWCNLNKTMNMKNMLSTPRYMPKIVNR